MPAEGIQRLRAVRAGHRGVLTKLLKEAEALLKETELDKGRLNTIATLLDEKNESYKDSRRQNLGCI